MTSSWSLVAKVESKQWMQIKEFPKMRIISMSTLAKSRILDQTQHDASWQRIQQLEAPKEQAPEDDTQLGQAPQFVQPLSGSIQANEGENIFLSAGYIPIDDK